MPLAGKFEPRRTLLAGTKHFPVSVLEASVKCEGGIGSAWGDQGFAGNPGGLGVKVCDENGALGGAKVLGGDNGKSYFTIGGDRGEEIEPVEVGRRKRDELIR